MGWVARRCSSFTCCSTKSAGSSPTAESRSGAAWLATTSPALKWPAPRSRCWSSMTSWRGCGTPPSRPRRCDGASDRGAYDGRDDGDELAAELFGGDRRAEGLPDSARRRHRRRRPRLQHDSRLRGRGGEAGRAGRRYAARQGADRGRPDAGLDCGRRQRPAVGHGAAPGRPLDGRRRRGRRSGVGGRRRRGGGGRGRAGRGPARRQDDGGRVAAGRGVAAHPPRRWRHAVGLAGCRQRRGGGGHAGDGADARPQGAGLLPGRAVYRPPGSGRHLGGDHRGRARARCRRRAMTSGASLRGHPASSGVAVGPAWLRAETKAAAGTPAEERARVERGLRAAADELAQLAGRLREEGRSADAEIVEANLLMSEDAALVEAALAAADGGAAAAVAIAEAAEPHVRTLAALDDPMLAARAADLRSIVRRAGELAAGLVQSPPPGSIVVADDLGPGDVAAWSRSVAGIALSEGGTTAHAAIIARSLAIPLVTGVGAQLLRVAAGEQLAVDGDRGLVVRAPDGPTRARLERRLASAREEAE